MSLTRLRAWRLERAELKLADLEYYNGPEGRWFQGPPSEARRFRLRIGKAQRRVEKLSPGLPKRGEKP